MRTTLALLLLLPSLAVAAPDGLVPVQGQLSDSLGVPVDGTVDVTYTLYRDLDGADPVWSDTMAVEFDQGAFTSRLGSGAPLDLALFRDEVALYLGVQVGDDPEMDLVELAAVPWAGYAHHAGSVEGLSRADIEGGLQTTADVEGIARDVCYDTEDELTAALDGLYLPSSYQPSWTDLQDVPLELTDGDDDTTYAAGTGLTLTGTTFSVDQEIVADWAYDTPDELTDALDGTYVRAEDGGVTGDLGVAGDLSVEGTASAAVLQAGTSQRWSRRLSGSGEDAADDLYLVGAFKPANYASASLSFEVCSARRYRHLGCQRYYVMYGRYSGNESQAQRETWHLAQVHAVDGEEHNAPEVVLTWGEGEAYDRPLQVWLDLSRDANRGYVTAFVNVDAIGDGEFFPADGTRVSRSTVTPLDPVGDTFGEIVVP